MSLFPYPRIITLYSFILGYASQNVKMLHKCNN
nr:MAG TPA: hypothetical protein [Caudoviricetes sp.]